jgi:hypothetical protein
MPVPLRLRFHHEGDVVAISERIFDVRPVVGMIEIAQFGTTCCKSPSGTTAFFKNRYAKADCMKCGRRPKAGHSRTDHGNIHWGHFVVPVRTL